MKIKLMIILVAILSLGFANVTFGKTYDVKKYGAKGDGKTDDTEAISSVIMEAAGTGGTVFFPAGTYLVLNLPVASKMIVPERLLDTGGTRNRMTALARKPRALYRTAASHRTDGFGISEKSVIFGICKRCHP